MINARYKIFRFYQRLGKIVIRCSSRPLKKDLSPLIYIDLFKDLAGEGDTEREREREREIERER